MLYGDDVSPQSFRPYRLRCPLLLLQLSIPRGLKQAIYPCIRFYPLRHHRCALLHHGFNTIPLQSIPMGIRHVIRSKPLFVASAESICTAPSSSRSFLHTNGRNTITQRAPSQDVLPVGIPSSTRSISRANVESPCATLCQGQHSSAIIRSLVKVPYLHCVDIQMRIHLRQKLLAFSMYSSGTLPFRDGTHPKVKPTPLPPPCDMRSNALL